MCFPLLPAHLLSSYHLLAAASLATVKTATAYPLGAHNDSVLSLTHYFCLGGENVTVYFLGTHKWFPIKSYPLFLHDFPTPTPKCPLPTRN